MLTEVKSAVQLIVHILSLNNSISKSKLEKFSECLEKLLCLRYEQHWHPQKPILGSAYRCIRITQSIMDTVIDKAATMAGLTYADLYKCLPQDFTLWIDPADVSYRIGEDGSICSLFSTNTEDTPSINLANQSCQAEVPTPLVIHNGSALAKCLSWKVFTVLAWTNIGIDFAWWSIVNWTTLTAAYCTGFIYWIFLRVMWLIVIKHICFRLILWWTYCLMPFIHIFSYIFENIVWWELNL